VDGRLIRIDPVSGAVVANLEFRNVSAYDVDAVEGSVWVTASGPHSGELIRVDPATNDAVAVVSVGPGSGAGGLGDIVADADAVWVTRGGEHDSLIRVDPHSNQIVATMDIPNRHYWNDMVLEGDSLWIASTGAQVPFDDGTHTNEVVVLRIDRLTGDVVDAITTGYGMFGIGGGNGSVWVYDGFHPNQMTQIDAATGAIVRRIEIPDGGSSWGGDPGIDAADGTAWMAGTPSLIRIDLETADSSTNGERATNPRANQSISERWAAHRGSSSR
jgi:hypothetical protein